MTWTPTEINDNIFKDHSYDQLVRQTAGLRLGSQKLSFLGTFRKYLQEKIGKPKEEPFEVRDSKIRLSASSFDARTEWPSCIHSVENQGSCGSCWAYAVTGMLEDRFCIASSGDIDVQLSAQDMIDCEYDNGACNGGMASNAINYLISEGVASETCVPETSYTTGTSTGQCSYKCTSDNTMSYDKYACQFSSATVLTATADIQTEIQTNGPMIMGLSLYEDFYYYSSGVYTHTTGDLVGAHTVKVVGWNYDGSGNLYWICQNSWGSSWGMSGYFSIYSKQGDVDAFAMSCTPDIDY